MKTIRVYTRWEGTEEFEVDDDVQFDTRFPSISDLLAAVGDLKATNVELVDWEIVQ